VPPIEDADPLDAGLAKAHTGEHARDAAAHDHGVDVVGDGLSGSDRGERVVAEPGEVLVPGQVADVGSAGDEPLVPLGQVLGVHGVGVEIRHRRKTSRGGRYLTLVSVRHG
jgi:hypothetical protein